MQKVKANGQLNNQGFTLIEMIVTVSIIAIFAGVVLNFITTGSSLFRNTSNIAKVQMETQETFDKIEDVIINANRRLSYGDSSHIFQVSSFDEQVAKKSSGAMKTATLRAASSTGNNISDDENVRDYIIWNQSSEEIRYIHSEKIDGTWKNLNTNSSNSHGDVLATGITYFQADVSKVISDNIVNFALKTRKGTKEVETIHSVSLRNNLNFDYTPDEPFDNPVIDPDNPNPDNPDPGVTTPKPISILADKKKILIAAGESYDLSQNNTYKVFYNDNSITSVGNLSWSVNGCTYANISSAGVLSVDASSGTADTGKVTITVTDTDHNNVFCTLEVSIARIDLIVPGKNATYKVGDEKQLQYTYLEGGIVETGTTISTEKKPEGAPDYSAEGTFTQNDIGEWRVRAFVNLSDRKGYDITYGTVENASEFEVIASTDIFINNDFAVDAVVAGRTYDCMPYINHGFNWRPVSNDVLWNKKSKMKWGIKGNTTGISIDSTEFAYPDQVRHITIEKNVQHGFIIYAEFVKDNEDGTSIHTYAEKEIKVVTEIELSPSDGGTVYAGESTDPLYTKGFEMKLLLDVYDINGNINQLCVSDEDGTQVTWYGLESSGTPKFSTEKKSWIFIPSVYDVNKTLQVRARLQRVAQKYGIFDPANNYYGEEKDGNVNENFEKSIPVKVLAHEYTMSVTAVDPETNETIDSCISGKTVKFIVQAYYDGNEMDNYNVTWTTWSRKFDISKNTAVYTIGTKEDTLLFQIQVVSENKTQNAEVQFDKNGIRFTNKW